MNFTAEGKIQAYCREHNREKIVIRQERRGDYFIKVRYEVCCDTGLFASPYVKETILDDPISWTRLLERTVISVRKTTINNKQVMEGLIRSLQAQYPEQFGKAKKQIFDTKKTEAVARAKNILQRAGLKHAQYLKKELAAKAKGVVEKGVKALIDQGVDEIMLNDLRTLQVTTGILPNRNGCIQYKKTGNREIYVMQYEPAIRTVFLDYNLTTKVGDRSKSEGYRLSFPWVIFIVVTSSGRYEQMHCFMSPKQIMVENQTLYEPLLPNMWLSTENKLQNTFSHVCTGSMELSGSTVQKVEQAINKFWQSNFNSDLSDALVNKMKACPEIRTFSVWEANSAKAPGFILKVPYKELITLERFLNRWNANVGNNGDDILKGLKKSLKENAGVLETSLVEFLAETIIPISDAALTEDFKAELEKIDAELAQIASATAEQLMTDANLQNTSWEAMEELIDASVQGVFDDLLKQIGIKGFLDKQKIIGNIHQKALRSNTIMFEVTVLKKGVPMPVARPTYIMTKNGLMLIKGNQVFDAVVPVKQVGFLQEVQQAATYKLPPISQAVFYKVWRLFREVYKKHQSEVNIFLYYDIAKKDYFFIVPRQNVSGTSTHSHDPADQITGALLVGTIHSHASMSAFHSGIDDRDEAFFDGLHITIGNLNDKDSFDISSSLVVNSTRFKFDDPMKVIAGIRVCPPKAPKPIAVKPAVVADEKQPADPNTVPAPPPAPVENIRSKAGKKRRFLTAGTRHNGVYGEFFVPDAEYSRYQIAKFGGYWYLPDPKGDEVLWYSYSWWESFKYMFNGMTYPELAEKHEQQKDDYYGSRPKKYYPDYGKKAEQQPQPEFLDVAPISALPSAKPVTGSTWANTWSPKKHWEFIPEDVEALEKTINPAEMEAWLAKVTGPFKASNLWATPATATDGPVLPADDTNRKPAVPPTDGQPKPDPNEKK